MNLEARPATLWRGDTLRSLAIWVLTIAGYWPALAGLARATAAHHQLRDAFIVLVFAAGFIVRDRGNRAVFRFDAGSLGALAASYGCMAGAIALRQPVLALVACALLVSAAIQFVFGGEARRLAWAMAAAFTGFLGLLFAFPLMDWPLRAAAARMSGWLLAVIGQDASLALATEHGKPALLLIVNASVFHVASECNGFGLISGSLLLALLLVIYRRLRWLDKVLSILVAGLVGLVFNALRILVISLLAPHVGNSYLLMHEVVGSVIFLGGLVLVWWLIWGLPQIQRLASAA